MKKKNYIEIIFLISLGVTSSFSLPPYNYLIINFFTFSAFFIFLFKKSKIIQNKKTFFLYGWLFGFGFFLSSLYWISISLTFDQNFKFLIPITVVLIPTFLGIFYGFVTLCFIISKPKKIVSSFFSFSLFFGIFEFIRGSILTGFPWNLIAYSFSNHLEILSITSFIGTYGFNLFCISLFTSPAVFILRDTKKDIGVCIAFLFMPLLFYMHGSSYKEKFNTSDVVSYNHQIRVIGSNISLDRFYLNIDPVSVINDLIEISEPTKNEKTIFLWPEGIFPEISQKELFEYKWLFEKRFDKNHLLLIGINNQTTNKESINYFNSLSIYDHNLELLNFYNKVNLVPFGEFLPFENKLKALGLRSITNNYQSFSKGNRREIMEINREDFSIKILPLICYEIIYSGKIFTNSNFDLIINISEDGWFGNSIGPKQHFTHSIFRAIESGKYLLRSANNGIAAIINPLGIVEQKVEYGKSGYVDFKETKKMQPTLFAKYGNKIFITLILLYIFIIFSFNRIKNE
ncbi:apolipoprotein N-acyltransferase [Candidatus Pelagibacter bacterium nBUS_27]|uniref:apolipoprotein N-acyltransferase n=1 Tax=Candidatus Pelagibacter bacterium nBUS_27 TaxID=3374188 RepID=UPI003EC0E091